LSAQHRATQQPRNNVRFACHPPDERSFVKARLTDASIFRVSMR
jgi:hypothetical protein